ncbi:MAG: hypothetical protein ABIA37_03860 [Candidatus Woesearchaeota archaeon]
MMDMNPKYWGLHKLIFGALLLLNAFIWPKWLGVDGWIAWIAVLMVICGLLKLIWPCSACKPMPKKKK